jgi:hypothetical protein
MALEYLAADLQQLRSGEAARLWTALAVLNGNVAAGTEGRTAAVSAPRARAVRRPQP